MNKVPTSIFSVRCFLDTLLVFFITDALHKLTTELDLVTCCIGELCTLNRNGTPWPVVYGVGVNVKTGDIFPAQFTDKGPDLDIRIARTLTGGENTGVKVHIHIRKI